ncbi:hypothetical protein [Pseudomonas segetis]|uniref:Morphogenetic protein n=1 Tax=Pseudomonas segetis TaxID=298908 RepID=A0A239CB14_9PSED|nr:hypothetical protein [Pseudomonas segetis]SNS16878.1 hypothetical protein SAMN05216255_1585 [Pseudomonas segetis]
MSVFPVKERPILFNGEMVRAILDGRKTVTRRPLKLPHDFWESSVSGGLVPIPMGCPYGKPGERLWVRESWWQAGDWQATYPEDDTGAWFGSNRVIYSADGTPPNEPNRLYPNALRNGSYSAAEPNKIWRHRPSIHMPRWACRILLEVTEVRVERLQDITEEQARAEGITDGGCTSCGNHEPCGCECPSPDAVDSFVHLWNSTGGDWGANPWVWVIEFKQIDAHQLPANG